MEFIPRHINDVLNRDLESSAVEMAKDRKLVLKNLDSLGDKISEHLGKILIYSSIKSCKETVSHWVREISTWCQIVGSYTVKPKSKKLSVEEYKKYVFEGYAESESELNWRLTEIEASNRRTSSFPPVNLSNKRLNLAWITFRNITEKISSLFAGSRLYSSQEYSQVLNQLLADYLNFED